MNFTQIPIILNEFKTLLNKIIERQDMLAEQIASVLDKVTTNELTMKQTESKFLACAKGFHQTKMAIEILLEQLDSATGQITEQSWND